ncbi:MAG TPA: 7-carboxy-7-deazaguanine synthase [Gemmatimonadales bacterium]
MSYAVKELYYTLQGEGANTGRPAVFVRFAGCNLWSGVEADRASAVCRFCDTDFVGTDGPRGGKYRSADALALAVAAEWERGDRQGYREAAWSIAPWDATDTAFCVLTGGEPLLQVDGALIAALHRRGMAVAVETNGTIRAPEGLDWVCVSPKAGVGCAQRSGNELKLVYPQDGVEPRDYEDLAFDHFFLQPMDGPNREANTRGALEYCRRHPLWRLSLQTHKLIGIP